MKSVEKSVERKTVKRAGFNIGTKIIVKDDITAEFLRNMRRIRKTLGLTQAEIADYAQVSRTCVVCYEKERAAPILRVLIKLAEVLKADISGSINYKFFYKKISPEKLKKAIRAYGLSFAEIGSLTGWCADQVSLAARMKPNASIRCLDDILKLLDREKAAYAVRQHITRKGA